MARPTPPRRGPGRPRKPDAEKARVPTIAFRVAEEIWQELERRAAAIPSPLGSRGVSVHDIARELMLRAMQGEGGSDPA